MEIYFRDNSYLTNKESSKNIAYSQCHYHGNNCTSLQGIYKVFSNPANDEYAWVGAESAEAIFLNDFRWSSELITWQNFVLLFEGEAVHLPSPKNHFAKDVCITTDFPIIATGKSEAAYIGKYNQTEMMAAHWKAFKFSHQFKEKDQKDIPPCCKCFAKLAVFGKDAWIT